MLNTEIQGLFFFFYGECLLKSCFFFCFSVIHSWNSDRPLIRHIINIGPADIYSNQHQLECQEKSRKA